MPTRPDPSPPSYAGRAIAAALVVLALIPAYVSLSPAWRPAAVRLSCAALVVAGCMRALRWLRGAVGPPPDSPLDAPPPEPPSLELDARFVGLRDDLVSSARSRRYFDVILWPRLSELAGRDLPRPAARRGIFRRRGPAWASLEALVAEAERRA